MVTEAEPQQRTIGEAFGVKLETSLENTGFKIFNKWQEYKNQCPVRCRQMELKQNRGCWDCCALIFKISPPDRKLLFVTAFV